MTPAFDPQRVLERDVIPALFPPTDTADRPELTLVVGAVGSAPRRAVARAIDAEGQTSTLISAETLRPFHPEHSAGGAAGDEEAARRVDEAVAEWVRAALRYARGARRSIIIDGVTDSGLAVAVGKQYAAAGYHTQVTAVASPPSRALLSVASLCADGLRSGRPRPVVGRAQFDASVAQVTAILESAGEMAAFDRVVVYDDRGHRVHDSSDAAAARDAFEQASRRGLSGLEAAQWLGELRRVTEFTRELRRPPAELVEALIDIHEIASHDVVPALPVPHGSEVITIEGQRIVGGLTALRRIRPVPAQDPSAGPAVTAPDRGRSLGR